MKWMVPFSQLGEDQRRVLNSCTSASSSNHWIKGFAGSGKTVLLVHLLDRLEEEHPGSSVCIVVYTHALKDLVKTGIDSKRSDIPVLTYHAFLEDPDHYDFILMDEVQDLASEVVKDVSNYADTLIVAGDHDQSIYLNSLSESALRGAIRPKTHQLRIVYRLSRNLVNLAKAILPGSKIESATLSKTANVKIVEARADSYEEEFSWLYETAIEFAHPESPSAILFTTRKAVLHFLHSVFEKNGSEVDGWPKGDYGKIDYDEVNGMLTKLGVPFRYLGSSFGDLYESDDDVIVYLMTYHSAKGLDFQTVFLPNLNHNTVFWRNNEDLNRRIFFVGATRSRRNLFLSYHSSRAHPFVKSIPGRVVNRVACEDSEADEDFYF